MKNISHNYIITLLIQRFIANSVIEHNLTTSDYQELVQNLLTIVQDSSKKPPRLITIFAKEIGPFNIVTAPLYQDIASAYLKKLRKPLTEDSVNDIIT